MDYSEAVVTTTARRAFTASFLVELSEVFYDIRWLILLAIVLILADLWFGISAAKFRGDIIRKSRAGRRTINKFCDYLFYILIGMALGKAFGDPLGMSSRTVSTLVLMLCYAFELDSIYGHICELHEVRKTLSIWSILIKILTFRFAALKEAFKPISTEDINVKPINENEEEENGRSIF